MYDRSPLYASGFFATNIIPNTITNHILVAAVAGTIFRIYGIRFTLNHTQPAADVFRVFIIDGAAAIMGWGAILSVGTIPSDGEIFPYPGIMLNAVNTAIRFRSECTAANSAIDAQVLYYADVLT